MGLWRDTGDRAMPIKMNVNPGNSNQVKEAFEALVREMREKNSATGFIAAQSYNQMHWSTDPNEAGFKKHGLIGMEASDAIKSSWSGREHKNDNLTFEGFEGVMNILGGDWQNAVYKVTVISHSVKNNHAKAEPTHLKPGKRFSYAASEAYVAEKGGELMTLEEARTFMNG
jgi:hypothetical protein